MPPNVAQLIGWAFIFYAFRSQKKRGEIAPKGLLLPTIWYLIVSTRTVGIWFSIWGLPVIGGGTAADGSPMDAAVFLLLAIAGAITLAKRSFSWGEAFARNPWPAALLIYMAASICWSSYNYVSFKRYVKAIGSLNMALVVLTQEKPLESIQTVLRRVLYMHLPMSLICIKYFRNIGVSFDFSGSSQAWTGLSTSKNELGQVVMLGVLYFTWELHREWKRFRWKNLNALYLLLSLYLLKGSENEVSMTSISVGALALLLFFRMKVFNQGRPPPNRFVLNLFWMLLSIVGFVAIHSVVHFSADSLFGHMITMLGRDITMTGRTEIWHDVYEAASRNPLLGVGYGGFWIGRDANIPWNAWMTWVLGQAHNGYVDTYLQLGIIGVILLVGCLITTVPRLLADLATDYDFATFRIILLVTTTFVNTTETTFLRGDHHLWFILQLTWWLLPSRRPVGIPAAAPRGRAVATYA